MSGTVNLARKMKSQLPAGLVDFMRAAGEVAQSRGNRLYLVGGVVRDQMLERTNLDLDLVVEGDAINLAQELVRIKQGEIITHPRFGTAKIQRDKWSIDLVTARSETYSRPGALPTVKPGSIESDLFRRDFTINAMAVELAPGRYGDLLDLYGGRGDLEHRLIRVLHEKSFVDDATRIWRGLRYEQRLDFRLEQDTLELLNRDIPMLDTISGDRIRHELELALKEELPEKVLCRAGELGVLARLHPSLKGDGWLAEKFEQARQLSVPDLPSFGLYLALLAYRLSSEETEQLISCLRLPKPVAQIIRDTAGIKAEIGVLSVPGLAPSAIYSLLHGRSSTALTASSLATGSPAAEEHIQLYLGALRHVKTALSGEDLKRMGIAEGPRIKEILNRLREARLDGKVGSRSEEEEMVRGYKPAG
ncbi:CCA tRNA nucleotidyltransferase [Chloroflexota bacterium]